MSHPAALTLKRVRLVNSVQGAGKEESWFRIDKQDRKMPVEITMRADLRVVAILFRSGEQILVPFHNIRQMDPAGQLPTAEELETVIGGEAVMPDDAEETYAQVPDMGPEQVAELSYNELKGLASRLGVSDTRLKKEDLIAEVMERMFP